MKMLHTADIHLHNDHPRRLQALDKILSLGREQEIDLLLIAGDLFDDHLQAELLRNDVRRLFNNLPFKVLAIPGNHDERAFAAENFYGSEFIPLTSKPFSVWEQGDWRVTGLPYYQGSFSKLIPDLKRAVAPGKTNILLIHCSWSLPHYSGQDYGGDERYLPVTEETLTGLGYNYILAGHFHTAYRQRKLPCGSLFIYPGSPVSVTSKEQGPRSVNLLDSLGCRQLLLPTWYYYTLEFNVSLDTKGALEELAQKLNEHSDAACALSLQVGGYIHGNEAAFYHQLEDLIAHRKNTSLIHNYRSIEKISSDPLYQRCIAKLRQSETGDSDQIEGMLLDAFSQLLAEG